MNESIEVENKKNAVEIWFFYVDKIMKETILGTASHVKITKVKSNFSTVELIFVCNKI